MSGGSWNYLFCKDIDELMNGSSTELLQMKLFRQSTDYTIWKQKQRQRKIEQK